MVNRILWILVMIADTIGAFLNFCNYYNYDDKKYLWLGIGLTLMVLVFGTALVLD